MNTRTTPPHPFVKFRYGLLLLAILAWLGGIATIQFRAHFSESVANLLTAFAGLVFVWSNGFFWWFTMRYPRIEIAPGKFASYEEWTNKNSGAFFVCYWIAAVLVSIACIRAVIHG